MLIGVKIYILSGVINLKKAILPKEIENSYCATVRAIDDRGRSETAAVTIGFDGFIRECHKIDNFTGLQPITYIPPQSHLSKPLIETDITKDGFKYTSEIPELYFVSHATSSSLSSTFSSTTTKIDEVENSEVTSSVTREHGYTKLIATQKVSDSNRKSDLMLGSSSPLQLSSTISSDSRADSRPDLSVVFGTSSATDATSGRFGNSGLKFTTDSITKSVDFSTGKSYKAHIIGSTKKGTLLPHEEIHHESDKTDRSEITSSDSFSENGRTSDERKNRLWYSSSQRSDISSTTTIDLYSIFSTTDQSITSSESEISIAPLTFIYGGTDDSPETTEDSDITLLTEKDTSNERSKEVPGFYSLFSTKAPIEKGLFPVAVLAQTTLAPSYQTVRYTESTYYNVSTANTIYFHSPNSNLEIDLPSPENNTKPIITDATTGNGGSDNYQSQVTSFHGSTFYSVTSPTSLITDNAERSNIQSVTNAGEIFIDSVDIENISEMACRLKNTQPIWSLICDLSKTSKSTANQKHG